MESQPQNPEFRNNPENFHPWKSTHILAYLVATYSFCSFSFFLSSTWSSLEQRDTIIRFYHIHPQMKQVPLPSPKAGVQIYGGPGSLPHDFKIWPIAFQGSGPSGPILLSLEKISL